MKKLVSLVLFLSSCAWSQTVVQFSADPADTPSGAFATGPFPTDTLTVPSITTSTGLLVNLPPSEASCAPESSPVCSNNSALNQLDGFSVNPRLMVCFSSPIDPATLPAGITLMSLPGPASALPSTAPVSINQVIFDPHINCAFAKPNQVLKQNSKYLLLVTNAVHDNSGNPVTASPAFATCIGGSPDPYCVTLASSLARVKPSSGSAIVAASEFTTMYATAWLEGARKFVDKSGSFVIPAGWPATFAISQLKTFTWLPDAAGLPPQNIPLGVLSNVSSVSFGLFLSPNYLNTTGPTPEVITSGPTAPLSYSLISFHVFMPEQKDRDQRVPVVIYGHGLGDNQFGAPTYIASTLANKGFATVVLELPGHGYGPGGMVQLTDKQGRVSKVYTPGRGVPKSPGAIIGSTDGCISLGPIGVRDCGRQAAVDLAALVKAISATDGLALDLDEKRIYYVGQSFGATAGTLFHAVEPAVPAAVLSGAGGTSADIARLAITGRPLGLLFLSTLGDPFLFNVVTQGAPPEAYFHDQFNDNYPFRDLPPATNTIPGAMAIQAAFEAPDWLGMVGDPLAFAPHLQSSPLNGVPKKHTLFQFGFGDLEVPNPTESAVVRAAQAQSTTSFFHFERAVALDPSLLAVQDPAFPGLPILPHRILSNPTLFTSGNGAETSIALCEQMQAGDFFLTNGRTMTNANKYLTAPFSQKDGLFENPVNSLPENLNFLQIPK